MHILIFYAQNQKRFVHACYIAGAQVDKVINPRGGGFSFPEGGGVNFSNQRGVTTPQPKKMFACGTRYF